MSELSTLTLADGRQLAWAEHGDLTGTPALSLHGTPGGRLSAATHAEAWAAHGIRLIAPERPGYGASTPNPGRRVVDVAADLLALLDHLGVHSTVVVGGSGGGPHALALAARAPERVQAVGVLVGAAPLAPEEVAQQIGANQAVFAALDDPARLRQVAGGIRDLLLGDGLLALMADAPDVDRAQWAQVGEALQRALASALEPGVEGLVEDYQAIFAPSWGFEPEEVVAPVVWAHGEADRNVPLPAARRYAARLPDCDLRVWTDVGHAPSPAHLAEFAGTVMVATRPVRS